MAIPIDMIGIIAVRRMQKNLLAAFAFLKSLFLGLMVLIFADIITYAQYLFIKEHRINLF